MLNFFTICVLFVSGLSVINSRSLNPSSTNNRYRRSATPFTAGISLGAEQLQALKGHIRNSPRAVNILPAPTKQTKNTKYKFRESVSGASALTNIIATAGATRQSLSTVPLGPSLSQMADLGSSLTSLTSESIASQVSPDFLPEGIVFGTGVPLVSGISTVDDGTPDMEVPTSNRAMDPNEQRKLQETAQHPFMVHVSDSTMEVHHVPPPSSSVPDDGLILAGSPSALGPSLADQGGVEVPVVDQGQLIIEQQAPQWVWPDGVNTGPFLG